ncbi:MAG: hypothetical protein WD473_00490, partial [Acidimicrobiia bacterium]
MSLRSLVFPMVAAALLLSAPAAQAKGPSQGVIEGPGIAPPLALRDPGERTIGPNLAAMVQESGLLAQLFGNDDVRELPPSGELGARYTVRYTMDGTEKAVVTQYVFPFATTGPVTYMPPGQRFWDNGRTGGGWFSAKRKLRDLVEGFGAATPRASLEGAVSVAPQTAGVSRLTLAAAPAGAIIVLLLFLGGRAR